MGREIKKKHEKFGKEVKALKEKLIQVLEYCDDKTTKKNTKNAAGAGCSSTLHISKTLYASLHSSLAKTNQLNCARVLRHLVRFQQCSVDFVLQLMTAVLEGDVGQAPALGYVLDLLGKLPVASRDEARLLHLLHHLNAGRFKEALSVATSIDDLQGAHARRSSEAAEASTNLLNGYKTLLQYVDAKSRGEPVGSYIVESFEALSTKKSFFPLFAEAYTSLLVESSQSDKAVEFLTKFVESESKESGLLAPLLALDIAKRHLSKNKTLQFQLLQAVAEKDPGHVLVLDLCWKYLRNSVPGRRCDSDSDLELSDDDDDEGRGGDHFSRSKPRNLNICLGLILDYLDTDLASGRAWTILSENLRIICLLGAKECAAALVHLWHTSDRRSWWHDECFAVPTDPQPDVPAELLVNKAVSCFVLEGSSHPFVTYVLATVKRDRLRSLMKQLGPAKRRLDDLVQPSLALADESLDRCDTSPLQKSLGRKEADVRHLFLRYLRATEQLDDQQLSAQFNELIAVSKPIQSTDVCRRNDADFFWHLPLYQRFKHRLKKRQVRAKRLKGAEPQSPPASTSLSSSASATDSEDEIVDRLIRGPPAPGDDDNDDHLFARPQAPPAVDVRSTWPPASLPCPTPELPATPASTSAKETIRIEDHYQFFLQDNGSSSSSCSSSSGGGGPSNAAPTGGSSPASPTSVATPASAWRAGTSFASSRLETSSPDMFQLDSAGEDDAGGSDQVDAAAETPATASDSASLQSPPPPPLNCLQIIEKYLPSKTTKAPSKAKEAKRRAKTNKKKKKKPMTKEAERAVVKEDVEKKSHSRKKITKKKKNKEKNAKVENEANRDELIAKLLSMSARRTSVAPPPEPPIIGSAKPGESEAEEQREGLIEELLRIGRRSLSCAPGRRSAEPIRRSVAADDLDVPTDAEELLIQRAIEQAITTGAASCSTSHTGGSVEKGEAIEEERLLSHEVDAQQRVAQWLERVLVENRCGAARGAERPAKRRRTVDDPSPEEQLFVNGPKFAKRLRTNGAKRRSSGDRSDGPPAAKKRRSSPSKTDSINARSKAAVEDVVSDALVQDSAPEKRASESKKSKKVAEVECQQNPFAPPASASEEWPFSKPKKSKQMSPVSHAQVSNSANNQSTVSKSNKSKNRTVDASLPIFPSDLGKSTTDDSFANTLTSKSVVEESLLSKSSQSMKKRPLVASHSHQESAQISGIFHSKLSKSAAEESSTSLAPSLKSKKSKKSKKSAIDEGIHQEPAQISGISHSELSKSTAEEGSKSLAPSLKSKKSKKSAIDKGFHQESAAISGISPLELSKSNAEEGSKSLAPSFKLKKSKKSAIDEGFHHEPALISGISHSELSIRTAVESLSSQAPSSKSKKLKKRAVGNGFHQEFTKISGISHSELSKSTAGEGSKSLAPSLKSKKSKKSAIGERIHQEPEQISGISYLELSIRTAEESSTSLAPSSKSKKSKKRAVDEGIHQEPAQVSGISHLEMSKSTAEEGSTNLAPSLKSKKSKKSKKSAIDEGIHQEPAQISGISHLELSKSTTGECSTSLAQSLKSKMSKKSAIDEGFHQESAKVSWISHAEPSNSTAGECSTSQAPSSKPKKSKKSAIDEGILQEPAQISGITHSELSKSTAEEGSKSLAPSLKSKKSKKRAVDEGFHQESVAISGISHSLESKGSPAASSANKTSSTKHEKLKKRRATDGLCRPKSAPEWSVPGDPYAFVGSQDDPASVSNVTVSGSGRRRKKLFSKSNNYLDSTYQSQ